MSGHQDMQEELAMATKSLVSLFVAVDPSQIRLPMPSTPLRRTGAFRRPSRTPSVAGDSSQPILSNEQSKTSIEKPSTALSLSAAIRRPSRRASRRGQSAPYHRIGHLRGQDNDSSSTYSFSSTQFSFDTEENFLSRHPRDQQYLPQQRPAESNKCLLNERNFINVCLCTRCSNSRWIYKDGHFPTQVVDSENGKRNLLAGVSTRSIHSIDSVDSWDELIRTQNPHARPVGKHSTWSEAEAEVSLWARFQRLGFLGVKDEQAPVTLYRCTTCKKTREQIIKKETRGVIMAKRAKERFVIN